MKKFFSFLAAAAMLFTASCSNDDLGNDEGGDALVSFSMNLDGVSSTKADIGKGTLVDQLQYAVFEITKNNAGEVTYQKFLHKYETMNNVQWPAQVDIRLAKNKSYRVVFWAQDASCNAYTVTDDMNVTVDYAGINNDETRDAFFGYADLENVSGSIKQDVTLKRPFAQLNVGVTAEDWQGALFSGVEMTHSTVTVNQVANTINLFNGEIGANNTSVTYTMAQRPNEQLYVDITDDGVENFNEFYYLSMSYLLVEQNNVSADFTFSTAATGGHEISLNIPTVPVTRNHRTNILGQILTGNVTFNVYIDADFDGDIINEFWNGSDIKEPAVDGDIYLIKVASELAWVANEANNGNTFEGKTIKLVNNIFLNDQHWTPIAQSGVFKGTFEGNDKAVNGLRYMGKDSDVDFYIGLFGNAENATFKNLVIENVDITFASENDNAGGHVGALVGCLSGTSSLENITVKGNVKINGEVDKTGASRVGGVIGGNAAGSITVKNVKVEANEGGFVQGNSSVGGIAGQLVGGATFENCSSNLNVIAGKFFAGGIIGLAPQSTTFTNCHTTGNISVLAGRAGNVNDLYRVGGIAGGWGDGNIPLVLNGCSYTGTLVGKDAAGATAERFDCGGFVGRGYTAKVGTKVYIDGVEYVYQGSGNYLTTVETTEVLDAALNQGANNIEVEGKIENVGDGFEVKQDVILNFNNKELNAGSTANSTWYALEIINDANVEINDANFTRAGVYAAEGANVVFNSGKINHKPERTSRYIFCAQSGATITVKAGTFTNDRAKNNYFWADNATIVVEGGNFGGVASTKKVVTSNGGQVIIKGGTFNFDPTTWVAAGYIATKSGSTWTVTAQ